MVSVGHCGFLLTVIDPIIVSRTVFTIFDCNFNDLMLCRTVQEYPGSKFIVPLESPLMYSYLISIKSNIVSFNIVEIFDKYISIEAMVTIESTCGLADRNILG